MVKILSSLLLIILTACNSRELNIGALDLNRYVKDLSASTDSFPAYVKLMTPGNDGVIPAEVAEIVKFFEDKSQRKQLFLVGHPGAEVDARLYAMALHDKNTHMIEILMDKLDQDGKTQYWTPAEHQKILEAVLKQNDSENTVFLMRDLNDASQNYRVIIKSSHKAYAKSRFPKKAKKQTGFVPLQEFIRYVGSEKLGVLVFAFLQGHDLLEAAAENPGSELSEHVFAQFQALNQATKSNFDIQANILAMSQLELNNERLQEINDRIKMDADYFIDLPKFLKTMEVFQEYSEMFKELSEHLEKIRFVKKQKGE